MSKAIGNKSLLLKLSLLAVLMFSFAIFVMPPLYNLFCDILGIGGKTGGAYTAVDVEIDKNRSVEVQFVAMNNATMPWEFYPKQSSVWVHPGESKKVTFYAHNRTANDMVGQAIPSLIPFSASNYFHKTECFCFNSQPLSSGEEADLELVFIVDPDLPKSLNTLTLSYTLFDITHNLSNNLAVLN